MLLRERSAARPSGFIEPCRPSKAIKPPSGPDWLHEIKHDGFRLMVRREGSRVRHPATKIWTGPRSRALSGPTAELLGASERARATSALIEREALTSESTRAPLRLNSPAALASRWMPGLFPEKAG